MLGLASNLDQFLNMRMVERVGAGRCLRASQASPENIREAALELLEAGRYRHAAAHARRILASYDGRSRVQDWLTKLDG